MPQVRKQEKIIVQDCWNICVSSGNLTWLFTNNPENSMSFQVLQSDSISNQTQQLWFLKSSKIRTKMHMHLAQTNIMHATIQLHPQISQTHFNRQKRGEWISPLLLSFFPTCKIKPQRERKRMLLLHLLASFSRVLCLSVLSELV
jgi:hypothetical protein